MKIDDEYSVDSDALTWVLRYEKKTNKVNKKGGAVFSRRATYHGTLDQVIMKYADMKAREGETIEDAFRIFLDKCEEARKTLKEEFKSYKR